jgi:hypothetical protein
MSEVTHPAEIPKRPVARGDGPKLAAADEATGDTIEGTARNMRRVTTDAARAAGYEVME